MKLPFTFQLFTLSKSLGWTTCRCAWLHLFSVTADCIAWSRDNIRFSRLPKRVRSSTFCNTTWNHVEASGHAFQVWSILFGFLVRFNCACNSRVDDVSHLQGGEMKAEGLWALSRILRAMWMHHFSSTSSPLVPYLMRAPFLGEVWVLRVPR